jgi:arylformamidase
MARRNSPLLLLPPSAAPVCFAVGADELPELIRQTHEYSQAWTAAGLPGWRATLSAVNHFSILDELAQPHGQLTAALLRLCRQPEPGR